MDKITISKLNHAFSFMFHCQNMSLPSKDKPCDWCGRRNLDDYYVFMMEKLKKNDLISHDQPLLCCDCGGIFRIIREDFSIKYEIINYLDELYLKIRFYSQNKEILIAERHYRFVTIPRIIYIDSVEYKMEEFLERIVEYLVKKYED